MGPCCKTVKVLVLSPTKSTVGGGKNCEVDSWSPGEVRENGNSSSLKV